MISTIHFLKYSKKNMSNIDIRRHVNKLHFVSHMNGKYNLYLHFIILKTKWNVFKYLDYKKQSYLSISVCLYWQDSYR